MGHGKTVLWISVLLEIGKNLHLFAGVESWGGGGGGNAAVCSEHEALLAAPGEQEESLLLHLCSAAASVALGHWEPRRGGGMSQASFASSAVSPAVSSLLGDNNLNFFSLS